MHNLKIISWNVNGLQGILKKDIEGKKTTITNLKKSGGKNNP
jgi:exonuclease III